MPHADAGLASQLVTWRAVNGLWACHGPAEVVVPGQRVIVTKMDGQTSEVLIRTVQAARSLNGRPYVYGWPDRKRQGRVRRSRGQ